MSVREAILAYTKGQSRHRIYIEEDIPLKKLEAARSKYVDGDDKIIVLVDDTVFGSGKDGICVGEDHLYVKQLLEKPKSFPIKSIRSLASKTKSFSSLEIYINGDLFVSLSQIEKEEHGYLMGILKAAQRGAKPPVEKFEPKPKPKSKPRREPSSSPAVQTIRVDIMHCSQCNSSLPASAKFCSECGTKVLPKGICAACNSKFPKNAKFCPKCGLAIIQKIEGQKMMYDNIMYLSAAKAVKDGGFYTIDGYGQSSLVLLTNFEVGKFARILFSSKDKIKDVIDIDEFYECIDEYSRNESFNIFKDTKADDPNDANASFISALIDGDFGDFEYENKPFKVIYFDVNDEIKPKQLKKNSIGFWLMQSQIDECRVGSDKSFIEINGQVCESGGDIFNALFGNSEHVAAFLK